MKKIKHRAWITLLLALALLGGMGAFTWRYVTEGRSWATFRANRSLYTGGVLAAGTVTDRTGEVLAAAGTEGRVYAADAETRIACLHAVGDAEGNIGTGALRVFADALSGYSLTRGLDAAEGGRVTLSIDAALNRAAWEALSATGRRGAVLLSDYRSGEILCMVSAPSYDPAQGFDASDSAYDGVYLNRCLSTAYTPGSVFKLVTLAAALEELDGLYRREFTCTGSTVVDGSTVTCPRAHGVQTIEDALSNSCNCAFAALSLELGGERLLSWAQRFGVTEQRSVSGVYTAAGQFEAAAPDSAALAWSGIGQSTDLVCPLTMLRAVSAIANRGEAVGPVLLAGEAAETERLLPAETAEALKAMMHRNVAAAYGADSFPGLKLCAKTGTAEVGDGSSHAWFVGFLDDPEHPYAFAVVLEHGGGGLANAGPVANAVLQAAVARVE